MDINSYSYTPHMLDEDDRTHYYENDDMYVEVLKERNCSRFVYYVNAFSYDGSLDYAEQFDNPEEAESAFNYIVKTYSNTPPSGDITEEVQNAVFDDLYAVPF